LAQGKAKQPRGNDCMMEMIRGLWFKMQGKNDLKNDGIGMGL
jgi:hypothetical protein